MIELLIEMEFQAVRRAESDVRREAMLRNAESSHYPAEIARLRADQRKAERVGLLEGMFALYDLRTAYDSVWADFYAGRWSAPSGGTAAP